MSADARTPHDTDPDPDAADTRRPAAGTDVRAEIEVRRSRFICLVRRAQSEGQARTLLADARAEFPDARHHCSAWVVSVPGAQPLRHSSDDSEPSGTAGRPMLDVLDGAGLTDVAAVVVRYFGGTLLGTGGLVRAYSDAVAEALPLVRRVRPVELAVCTVALPHADAGRVESELRSSPTLSATGLRVLDTAYDAEGVRLTLAVRDAAVLAEALATLTGGAAHPTVTGATVVDLPAH